MAHTIRRRSGAPAHASKTSFDARLRAALLGSVALAGTILAPGASLAQNMGCGPSGGAVVCEDNTDGVDRTGTSLTVTNDPAADIAPDDGIVGVYFTNDIDLSDLTVDIDLNGGRIVTTDASGIVIENTTVDRAVTLTMTGDIEATGLAVDDGTYSLDLDGISITTAGDGSVDADNVSVTTGDGTGDSTDTGAARAVFVDARGSIEVDLGDVYAATGAATDDSGAASGIDLISRNAGAIVTVTAGDVGAYSGDAALDDGSASETGDATGVRAYSYYGDGALFDASVADVAVRSGAATGSTGTGATSGDAVGIASDGFDAIDVSAGAITVSSGSATSTGASGEDAVSGNAFGTNLNTSEAEPVVVDVGNVTVSTGAAAAESAQAFSGNAYGVYVEAEGSVTIDAGDVDVRSGDVETNGVAEVRQDNYGNDYLVSAYGAAGDVKGVYVDTEGAIDIDVGNVTVVSGAMTGSSSEDRNGAAIGIAAYAEAPVGSIVISAGDIVATSGSVTMDGTALAGQVRGIDARAGYDGYGGEPVRGPISIDVGDVTVRSGDAVSVTGYADGSDAIAIDLDYGTLVTVRAGDIEAVSGSVTTYDGPDDYGDSGAAEGVDILGSGSVDVVVGNVAVVSGDITGVSYTDTGTAIAIDIDADDEVAVTALDVSATSGSFSAVGDSDADSGNAEALDIGGTGVTINVGTLTAVSGNSTAAGEDSDADTGIARALDLSLEEGGFLDFTGGGIVATSGEAISPSGDAYSGDAFGIDVDADGEIGVVSITGGSVTITSGSATGVYATSGDATGIRLVGYDGGSIAAVDLDVGSIVVTSGDAISIDGGLQTGDAIGIEIYGVLGDVEIAAQNVTASSGSGAASFIDGEGSASVGSATGIAVTTEGAATLTVGDIVVSTGPASVATIGSVLLPGSDEASTGEAVGIDVYAADGIEIIAGSLDVGAGALAASALYAGELTAVGGGAFGIRAESGGDIGITSTGVTVSGPVISAAVIGDGGAVPVLVVGDAIGIQAGSFGGEIAIDIEGDVSASAGTANGVFFLEPGDDAIVVSETGLVRGIQAISYAEDGGADEGGDVVVLVNGNVDVIGGMARENEGTFFPLDFPGAEGDRISAGIVAVSVGSVDDDSAQGIAEVTLNGALTTEGQFVDGVVVASAASTVTLADGASVSVTGDGARGIVVAPRLLQDGADVGVRSSENFIFIGEGASVLSEDDVAIVDLDSVSTVVDGAVQTFEASNETTVRLAGRLVGGGGTAVALNGGDDETILEPGFEVEGLVDAGEGGETEGDTFSLGGEAGEETFDVSLLSFDETADAGEQYLNFELFRKIEDSTFTLTGTNAEAGSFSVLGGSLFVNGSAANVDFPVGDGALLGGTGTIGSFVAQAGSTIAPGVPGTFGVLTTTGDATFEEGSTFEVALDDQGNNDRLNVGGSVLIEGGLIDVIVTPGDFPADRPYIIIQAEGTRTGTFDDVTDNLPDLDFVDLYEPDAVLLGVELEDDDFSEKAIAGGALFGAGFAAQNFSETLARRAGKLTDLDAAAPGAGPAPLGYATAYGEEGRSGRVTRIGGTSSTAGGVYGADLVIAEMAPMAPAVMGPTGGFGVWLGGLGETVDADDRGDTRGFEADSAGIAGGVEYRWSAPGWGSVLGVAGGYTRTDVDVIDGSADIDGGHVGVYGGHERGPFEFAFAVSYSSFDYEIDRTLGLGALGSIGAEADTDGDAVSGFVEAAYDLAPALGIDGTRFGPLARLRGVHAERDGYEEDGAGILNLTVEDEDVDQLYGGIGARLGSELILGGMVVSPTLDLLYERNFADEESTSLSSIAGVTGANFATSVTNGSKDLFGIGAAVGAEFTPGLTGEIRYDGAFGSDFDSHRGSATLSYRF